MSKISIDSYVLDTLMRELIQHDRRPSAFIVYIHLWNKSQGTSRPIKLGHQKIADGIGLSKSAVQGALKTLSRLKLVRSHRSSATAVPEHTVLRPWVGAK